MLANYFIWWPWLEFFSDIFLLENLILFCFFVLMYTFNMYMYLFMTFLMIFVCGLFLSVLQMDMFCGFLYVMEFTALFVSLLLLFYVNMDSMSTFLNLKFFKYFFFWVLFYFMFFLETLNILVYNYWFDYYECMKNFLMNDFFVLFLNFYVLNSFFLYVFCFLMFYCSLVCLFLNKIMYIFKNSCQLNELDKNSFFMKKNNFRLVSHQNLNTSMKSLNLFFFKKKWY